MLGPFERAEREAAPELRSFTYVRLPADDIEPPEELTALERSFGDQLFTMLRPRFAAEIDEVLIPLRAGWFLM